MRIRSSLSSALRASPLATVVLLAACSDAAVVGSPGRHIGRHIDIDDDAVALSSQVAVSNVAVRVVPVEGGASTPGYALTVVAEVAPPGAAGGALEATAIAFDGARAFVSYGTPGPVERGAVDVFELAGDGYLRLTSRTMIEDSDVNAVAASGDRLWLAGSTAAAGGSRGMLEGVTLRDGTPSLEDRVHVDLGVGAVWSIAIGADRVFAIGDHAVHALDPATGHVARVARSEPRSVAASNDALVLVRGLPAELEVMRGHDLGTIATYSLGCQEAPTSVEVHGDKAFISAGTHGVVIMDLNSGRQLAHLPPAGAGRTAAISIDDDLMFIANGEAGVSFVAAQAPFAASSTADASLSELGRLALPGAGPIDRVGFHDGYLFVARSGGVQVVRVERVAPPEVTPVVGVYPYHTTFDDDAGRAGWQLAGSWGWGTEGEHAATRQARNTYLDGNPLRVNQAGSVDRAMLELPVAIPMGDPAVLSFLYVADFTSAEDVVEIQVRRVGSTQWTTLTSFRVENAGSGRRAVGLDSYRGATIQVRFQQKMSRAVDGARRFAIDGLSIAPLDLPTFPVPFEAGFDSTDERSAWNLEGAWGWSGEDDVVLDANPHEEDLAGYDQGQHAELMGFLAVPDDASVELWYRSDLLDGDVVVLDVQTDGKSTWDDLVEFRATGDSNGQWTRRVVSLADFAGERLRLRVGYAFAPTSGTRHFAVGGVRVGKTQVASAAFPVADAFAGPWFTNGAIALGPEGLTARGFGAAVMRDRVTLPSGPSVLAFRGALRLDEGDRVAIDVQSGAVWTEVASFDARHDYDAWTRYEVALDAFAGAAVRLRVRVDLGAEGVVAIDEVTVSGLGIAAFDYPFVADLGAQGLADWIVNGTWRVGDGVVDANPGRTMQAGFGEGQVVAMPGSVHVPADAQQPRLTLSLMLGLADGDAVVVEAQGADGAWTALATYGAEANGGGFGQYELALDAYAGHDVRVRVRYAFSDEVAIRTVRLGDLRIADRASRDGGSD